MMENIYHGSERHRQSMTKAREAAFEQKQCPHCSELFVISNFNKHLRACLHDPLNHKHCEQCGDQIFSTNSRFCSKRCAAIVSNQTRKKPRNFTCLSCQKTGEHGPTSLGLYCNNRCQQAHKWSLLKERFDQGDTAGAGKTTLRRYVIERDGEKCSDCGIPAFWNGKPLTLDMDHINGNNSNNAPANLRLLCPNCHTQTPTWGKKRR
jgi:predicted nucleic acid-binding Zn ribbon protein